MNHSPSTASDASSATPRPVHRGLYAAAGKRTLDVIFGLAVLPLVAVATAFVGAAIKLDDRGPIFYRQERRGLKGRTFRMWKFRSMKVGAPDLRNPDRSTVAVSNDARITRVGRFLRKTSVDELPQFLNVLLGDMSVIGPRPNLTTRPLNELTGDELRRLDVRPGITGYNQAFYRNSSSIEERYRHDCYYIDHLTFGMDVRVVLATLSSVLKAKNVYSDEGNQR